MKKRKQRFWTVIKKNHKTIVDIAVLVLIMAFLLSYFKPELLFSNTTTTGGDTPGHNMLAHYLKTDLLPKGKLIGWYPYSFAGFPLFQYYFIFPYFMAALMSYIIPFNIAFKLATVLGIFLLPIAAYISTRLLGFRFPSPAIAASATLLFLFKEEGIAAGGTIRSALAGQFSFTLSLAFLILAFGTVYYGIKNQDNRKIFIANIIIISLMVLSHIFSLIPLILACTFFVIEAIIKKKLTNISYLAKIFGLAFLLTAFWTIPYLMKNNWTMMRFGYSGLSVSLKFLLSAYFIPAIAISLLAIVLSKFKKEYMYTLYWFVSIILFVWIAKSSLLTSRFENVLLLFILISAAGIFSTVEKWLKAKWIIPIVAMLIIGWYISSTNTSAASWINWNYKGLENKKPYETYKELNEYLLNKNFSGRIDFEYYNYNKYGSPRVFELSPMFHKKPVMEGLLLESSLTYPFFFYMQKEVSKDAWWPGFDIKLPVQNLSRGLYDFWLYNVKYFVVRDEHTKNLTKKMPEFVLEKTIDEFDIYRIGQKSQYVEVLNKEPVLLTTKEWKKYSFYWMNLEDRSVLIAFVDKIDEQAVRDFKVFTTAIVAPSKDGIVATSNITEGMEESNTIDNSNCVVNENIENQRLSFTTNCIGKPHIVKTSYYPNWKVIGAKRIYLLSPSLMLVFPEQENVVMYYGSTASDIIGTILSIITLLFIIILAIKKGLHKKIYNIEKRIENKIISKKNALFFFKIIITLVFLVGIIYYLSQVDFGKVGEAFKHLNYAIVIISILVIIISLALKAYRLRVLADSKKPLRTFFMIQTLSIFLANFTPGRIGEFIKIYLLKREKIPLSTSAYAAIIERVIDVIVLFLFGAVFYSFAIMKNYFIGISAIALIILFTVSGFIIIKKGIIIKIKSIKKFLAKIKAGKNIKPIIISRTFLLTAIIWIIEGFFLWILLFALGESIPILAAVGIIGIAAIASILTVLPLGIGPLDLSMAYLLGKYGIAEAKIVALLIIIRVAAIVTLAAAGIITTYASNINLKQIIKKAKGGK